MEEITHLMFVCTNILSIEPINLDSLQALVLNVDSQQTVGQDLKIAQKIFLDGR